VYILDVHMRYHPYQELQAGRQADRQIDADAETEEETKARCSAQRQRTGVDCDNGYITETG
jgi:hypothetical protein